MVEYRWVVERRDKAYVEARIKDILSRGKIVRFRNPQSGVTKLVREWNPDEYGDLKAFHSTSDNFWVCWCAVGYDIDEQEPEEEVGDGG